MSSQSQHRRLSRSVVNNNINFIEKSQHHPHDGSQFVNAQPSPQPADHHYLKADTSTVSPSTPARSPWLRMHQSQLPPTSAQILDCTNSLFNWGEQILASSNAFAVISPSPLLPLHSNRERGGMLAKVERTTEHATINMATNNSMGKWFSL